MWQIALAKTEYKDKVRDIFVAGIRDDEILQKLQYMREDLLTQSCDKVVLTTRTMKSVKDSVAATGSSNNG